MRHCATNRKVAGSIPDDIIGLFHSHNTSGRTMSLGLTQRLTEMSTGIIPGDKGGRCVWLITLHLQVPTVLKPGSLNLLEPSGPVQACNGIAFTTVVNHSGWHNAVVLNNCKISVVQIKSRDQLEYPQNGKGVLY
jgi:hypothetical protein